MKYDISGTNPSLIEEAAIDITWVLGQLGSALDSDVGDKSRKRVLESGPGDDLPSTKRY